MGSVVGLRHRDWQDHASHSVVARLLSRASSGGSIPGNAPVKLAKPPARSRRRALALEPLEPRLLLSADVFPGTQRLRRRRSRGSLGDGLIEELSTGLDAVETAIDRALRTGLHRQARDRAAGDVRRFVGRCDGVARAQSQDLLDLDATLFGASPLSTARPMRIWTTSSGTGTPMPISISARSSSATWTRCCAIRSRAWTARRSRRR